MVDEVILDNVNPEKLSQADLARLIGHGESRHRIAEWTKEGLPRNKDKKQTYNLRHFIDWTRDRAAALSKKKLEEVLDTTGHSEIKDRMLEAKTQQEELELAKKLGLLCRVDEAEHLVGSTLAIMSGLLQALPNMLATQLEGLDRRQREQKISDVLKNTLKQTKEAFKNQQSEED